MQSEWGFYAGFGVSAIVFAILLFSRRQSIALFRRTVGCAGLLISMVGLLMTWQLKSFLSPELGKGVAQLSLQKISEQSYWLKLDTGSGELKRFRLAGDAWRVDGRLLAWDGVFRRLGFVPAIRLERLSGRYDRLESGNALDQSRYDISEEQAMFDAWSWLNGLPIKKGFKLKYGSSVYAPMKDGARYSLWLRDDGLVVRPENELARQALERW